MAKTSIYDSLVQARASGQKQLAVLVDPDKAEGGQLSRLAALAEESKVDYFFVGGSLIVQDRLEECLQLLRSVSSIPRILFPGSAFQISDLADGLLFLSLISGRNAELLIGSHVIAAPYLKRSRLEVLPTGYMLVDGGAPTTVSYISNTFPIPADKDDIAACTAMAGEMLGLKMIFLDAGSGARQPVSTAMIEAVARSVDLPLVVGGGIRTPERALANVQAGADLIVVGNALETDPGLMRAMAQAIHSASRSEFASK